MMNVIDDASLLKLAEAEILGEAKRAKVRHAIAGPSGWQPVPKTNKSFLVNTLIHTLSSNRILAKKHGTQKDRERKLYQEDRKDIKNNNFMYQKPKKSEATNKLSKKNEKVKCRSEDKKRTKHSKDHKKSKTKKSEHC